MLLILEPSNFAKLETGQPIVKRLRDFFPELNMNISIMLTYTPDIVWVGDQLQQGKDFGRTIEASLMRPKVYSRELDAEALKRCEIKKKEG